MVIENWYLWDTFLKGVVATLIPSAIGLYLFFTVKRKKNPKDLPWLILGVVLQIPFIGYLGYWYLNGSLALLIAGFPQDQ